MKLIPWMAKHPVAANLLMGLLLIGGFVIGSDTKQEVMPEFVFDYVNISISYAGATPEEVEESIILPVEEGLEGIVGIKEMTSTAYEGVGTINVEIDDSVDSRQAMDDIKSAIDQITTFPDDAKTPSISLASNRNEVLSVAIYGDVAEQTLTEIAEEAKGLFLSDPNVSQAELSGVKNLEISIEVSATQLQRYRLTMPQVANAIRQATLDSPSGKIRTTGGDILIRTKERRYTALEYEQIPIISTEEGNILLKDIATIRDTFEESDSYAAFNGKPAVLVDVYRIGDQTPVEVSQAVKKAIQDLEKRLPESIGITILYDRSIVLEDRINLLLRNAVQGLILVLVVLTLFLDKRLAFWIMVGIPISFFGALLLMPSLDVSINMISLFSFILVLGLVVDDAVIVGENIYAHQQMGKSWTQAAIDGTLEISAPVFLAISTTVAAFLPFFMIEGIYGKFFRVIPIIVIVVLIFSLIESQLILPAHLAHQQGRIWKLFSFLDPLRNWFGESLERFIQGPYTRTLTKAIEYRYATVAIGIFLLLVMFGLFAGGHLKFTFFPKLDGDLIRVNLKMPFGTPARLTENVQNQLTQEAEELIALYEKEKGFSIAEGIFTYMAPSGSHTSKIYLALKPLSVRGFSSKEFVDRWKSRVGEIAGVESISYKYSTGPGGGGADITMNLIHPYASELQTYVNRLKSEFSSFPGVSEVQDSFADQKTEIQLSLKPKAYALGLDVNTLTKQVNAAFQGLEVLRVQRESNEVKVVIRSPLAERSYIRNLEDMLIRTDRGREVPLVHVANLNYGVSYSEINRVDGSRIVSVTAVVDSSVTNTEEILRNLRKEILPEIQQNDPLLKVSFGGDQKRQKSTIASLRKGGILAIFLIFGLLALQFRSYFQPFIVMVAIPFGVIGAFMGHFIMNYELSIISILGIVALTGVVVNDSLVLVDFVNRSRLEGHSIYEAIIRGCTRRFRPIMLTSLTTFFGLLPMIFEQSLQARFLIPMAISLGFGVMFATLITLMLIPSLYIILEDIRTLFSSTKKVSPIVAKTS